MELIQIIISATLLVMGFGTLISIILLRNLLNRQYASILRLQMPQQPMSQPKPSYPQVGAYNPQPQTVPPQQSPSQQPLSIPVKAGLVCPACQSSEIIKGQVVNTPQGFKQKNICKVCFCDWYAVMEV